MNPILQLLIAEGPSLVAFIKDRFRTANPEAPEPTSEEVVAAFEALFTSSLARDEFLIAALKAEIGE